MEVWRTAVLTGALLVLGGVAACATPPPGPGGDDPTGVPVPTGEPTPSDSPGPSVGPTGTPVPTLSPVTPGAGPTLEPLPVPSDLPAGATWLQVAVDADGSGNQVTWTLACDPATGDVLGGDHPTAAEACTALTQDAAVAAFTPTPPTTACTEQWGGPQVAVVRGVLAGKDLGGPDVGGGDLGEVRFDRTNGCEIGRWDALAALLGPAGAATM